MRLDNWGRRVQDASKTNDKGRAADTLLTQLQALHEGLDAFHAYITRQVKTPDGAMCRYGEEGEAFGRRARQLQNTLLDASNVLSGMPAEIVNATLQKKASPETLQNIGLEGVGHALVDANMLLRHFARFNEQGQTPHNPFIARKARAEIQELTRHLQTPLNAAAIVLRTSFGMQLPEITLPGKER